MHAYNRWVCARPKNEVAMTDQLADGFFLSTKTSMGAQNILAQCVSTDQPVLFSLSPWKMAGRQAGGGGWWVAGGGGEGCMRWERFTVRSDRLSRQVMSE